MSQVWRNETGVSFYLMSGCTVAFVQRRCWFIVVEEFIIWDDGFPLYFKNYFPEKTACWCQKKKLVPVSSFPVLCAHIVQIWWFIGWAVCGPFLQQQDGGQGGMWFCLFCRMILSGVVRTFFLNCCRIRGRVVWWWEMRSSHIDHALQIQYGDRLDV